MKPFILVLALMSVTVFAKANSEEVREFELKNLQMAPAHAVQATSGTLTLNYAQKTVKLQVRRRMPPCPAGMFCIQMMPQPLVIELPITEVVDDSCGIHHVRAAKDLRPVDGSLQEIQLEDIQDMTCQTFAPVVAHASYTTRYFDRQNGKEIQNVSRMELMLEEKTNQIENEFTLNRAQLISGFSPMEAANRGTLKIMENSLQLDIEVELNCPPNAMCAAVMPVQIHQTLSIVKKMSGNCGDKILARLDLENGGSAQVDLTDYRNARCQIYMPNPILVKYQVLKDKEAEKKAVFLFDHK